MTIESIYNNHGVCFENASHVVDKMCSNLFRGTEHIELIIR